MYFRKLLQMSYLVFGFFDHEFINIWFVINRGVIIPTERFNFILKNLRRLLCQIMDHWWMADLESERSLLQITIYNLLLERFSRINWLLFFFLRKNSGLVSEMQFLSFQFYFLD